MKHSQIRELFPLGAREHLAQFHRQHRRLFDEFEIDRSDNRLHFFLAQIGHESGGLTVRIENMRYSASRMMAVWPRRFTSLEAAEPYANNPRKLANNVYANRMGNGPPESGDGWKYRGRGYIQITGRSGYRKVGEIAGLDLESEPDLAFSPRHALRVACAFWRWKRLNPIADRGDFNLLTRRINGGTVGIRHRHEWLEKVRRILAPRISASRRPREVTVVDIQRALLDAGYVEVGAADGLVGPKTRAAVARFRAEHNLGRGGLDKQLTRALGLT